jgi:hypothetical protein
LSHGLFSQKLPTGELSDTAELEPPPAVSGCCGPKPSSGKSQQNPETQSEYGITIDRPGVVPLHCCGPPYDARFPHHEQEANDATGPNPVHEPRHAYP